MAEKTFEPTKSEWRTAFNGLRMQAKSFGLNPNQTKLAMFIEHEADVISSLFAQARFLDNIIHKENK